MNFQLRMLVANCQIKLKSEVLKMNLRVRFAAMLAFSCAYGMLSAAQTPAAQNPKEQAWSVLNSGLTNSNIDSETQSGDT